MNGYSYDKSCIPTLQGLFSDPNAFPSLTSLDLSLSVWDGNTELANIMNIEPWQNARMMWSNLKKLEFGACGSMFVVRNSQLIPNLENLFLSNAELDAKVTVTFPKLKRLALHRCVRFVVVPSKNHPVDVSLSYVDVESSRDMFQRIEMFSRLKISCGRNNLDIYDFVFSGKLKKQKSLKTVSLSNTKFSEDVDFIVHENVETVILNNTSPFCDKNIFSGHENLKLLSLTRTRFVGDDITFPFFQSLKSLRLYGIQTLDKSFFHLIHWNSLEHLRLSILISYDEEKEIVFPCLKSMELQKVNHDITSFLENSSFPCLKELRLVHGAPFTGKKFTKFECLKNLVSLNVMLIRCLEDVFFEKMDLSNLKMLSLQFMDLKGVGWNHLPSLEDLRVSSCKNFGDLFFQHESNLKKLKKLELFHCQLIKGKDWSELPSLEILDVKNVVIGDEVFEKMKNLVELYIKNCVNVKITDWKKWGKLTSIEIRNDE